MNRNSEPIARSLPRGAFLSRDDRLTALGFDSWFRNQPPADSSPALTPARVTAVHKDSYRVTDGCHEAPAELVGRMIYGADSPLDLPTVGDWVRVRYHDDGTFATIHEILPRKTLLKRKTAGRTVEFQLIGANIDTALIVQSLDGNFNLPRLERYLVMTGESRIGPIVLLSKSDLVAVDEIESKTAAIARRVPNVPVQPFSNTNGSGLDGVSAFLVPGRTYCLLGSSGVGKTTLLNHLIGESRYGTKTVREKDGKGRHATTSRQLIRLPGGALVVDSPGMRELGLFAVESGLDDAFSEITALSGRCRFRDCSHTDEQGCAVRDAVEEGTISDQRYRNFIKISKEAAFQEMTYLEKKRRDKQFGKLVKRVMKHKKNN